MHGHEQMQDWVVYVLVFGTVGAMLFAKFLMMSGTKSEEVEEEI